MRFDVVVTSDGWALAIAILVWSLVLARFSLFTAGRILAQGEGETNYRKQVLSAIKILAEVALVASVFLVTPGALWILEEFVHSFLERPGVVSVGSVWGPPHFLRDRWSIPSNLARILGFAILVAAMAVHKWRRRKATA